MALVSTNLQIRLTGTDQLETLPNIFVRFNAAFSFLQAIADGEGDGAAESMAALVEECSTSYSVVSTATSDLNLASFPGPFDNTLAFTAIKALLFYNQSVTAGENIIIGAAPSTPFIGPLGGTTPTVTVPPGNAVAFTNFSASGWTTSGANNLRLRAAAGTPQYTLYLVGLV